MLKRLWKATYIRFFTQNKKTFMKSIKLNLKRKTALKQLFLVLFLGFVTFFFICNNFNIVHFLSGVGYNRYSSKKRTIQQAVSPNIL